jgi:polyphosphate kinase
MKPKTLSQPRYFNLELSWLAFNERVLEEATNPAVPLLERVKFLSICASNLDEFYMVRVAGLKDQQRHGVSKTSIDGLTPSEQLTLLHAHATSLVQGQQDCWRTLQTELAHKGIKPCMPYSALDDEDKHWLAQHFVQEIYPILTPIAVDPAHPFPFIPNLGMAALFELKNNKETASRIALVPFTSQLPRFIALPKRAKKQQNYMILEDVIAAHFDVLFPGTQLVSNNLFRIIRDSDLDVEEDAEDLVRSFERAVKKRRRGRVIRVMLSKKTPTHLKRFLREKLEVLHEETHLVDGIMGMSTLGELYDMKREELKFEPFEVRFPERINDFDGDCFAAIKAKDIVVHHPYESFDVVVRFVEQATADPDVVSIKQTLYRTSNHSPIVRALIDAAEAGKSVTALVELKARFDEEANIRWARDMERAGVQVVYGFVDLKTHAKMSLITRREDGKLRSYAHFGTGNYHPITAKFYTDLSFFTSDKTLCSDAAQLFNFITGYAKPERLAKLTASPLHLRQKLSSLIDDEMAHAKAGKPAAIWAKMNNLIDPELIDKLYEASHAGVQIDLIIRGICGLRPNVKGLSENIRVKSIVGRFLEHARIYCFGNGHAMPSAHAKVYIGSADWMTRNMDLRVEVMVPIENATVHAQILEQIMVANLKDTHQSWQLQPDGTYVRTKPKSGMISAHDYFIENPSLSGRGKALKKMPLKRKKEKP